MKSTTMGIDIAKNVFEVYVEDKGGQLVDRCRLSRKKMLPWFANRPPCARRHGSLWRRPLLGARVGEAGAHGEADCAAVRQAVGADEQE